MLAIPHRDSQKENFRDSLLQLLLLLCERLWLHLKVLVVQGGWGVEEVRMGGKSEE